MAQKYHFDYETTYKSVRSTKKPINTDVRQTFFNSKDNKYDMMLKKVSDNRIEASIFDNATSMQHYFNIYNKDFPFTGKDFIYKYSVFYSTLKTQLEKEKNSRFFKVGEPMKQDSSTIYYVEECSTAKFIKCFQ